MGSRFEPIGTASARGRNTPGTHGNPGIHGNPDTHGNPGTHGSHGAPGNHVIREAVKGRNQRRCIAIDRCVAS